MSRVKRLARLEAQRRAVYGGWLESLSDAELDAHILELEQGMKPAELARFRARCAEIEAMSDAELLALANGGRR